MKAARLSATLASASIPPLWRPKKVEVETQSYQDAPAVRWQCEGDTQYTMEELPKQAREPLSPYIWTKTPRNSSTLPG